MRKKSHMKVKPEKERREQGGNEAGDARRKK